MPQERTPEPDIPSAMRRHEAAREANDQAQREANEKIRRLQEALQRLRAAQEESNAVALQSNETMRTALLSSLRLSGREGGNQYITEMFQGINTDFASVVDKHRETKDANLQTFINIFRGFAREYSANLNNGAFPRDKAKQEIIAQAVIGMRKTVDAANEYMAGSLPHLLRNDDGTLAIMKNPESGEMMERLESTLHLHHSKPQMESIARSNQLYQQWVSAQANRARRDFEAYQRIVARSTAVPEDRNLASIVRFCRTRGVEEYQRFVERTATGQRFRQDAESMAGIENALGWLETGIREFESLAGGAPSQPEAQPEVARTTPSVRPPATPDRTPVAPRETVEALANMGSFSIPADRKIFIRSPERNQTNYLEPHFNYPTLGLNGYATAHRSADRRTWRIEPSAGYTGSIEYSVDGRTWTRGNTQPESAPSAPVAEAQQPAQSTPSREAPQRPAPRSEAPARQAEPVQPQPQRTPQETPRRSSVTLSDGRTLPSLDIPTTPAQRRRETEPTPPRPQPRMETPPVAQPPVQPAREPERTPEPVPQTEPTRPAEQPASRRNVTLPDGRSLPSLDIPTTPIARPTPPTPPTKQERGAPQPQPESGVRSRSFNPEPMQGATPKGSGPTVPETPRQPTAPKRSTPTAPETPKQPTAPKRSPRETLRTAELRNRFFEILSRYQKTMKADYAKHGGSMEWKTFDQRFAQLDYEVAYHFKGNIPRFLTERSWGNLLDDTASRVGVDSALKEMTSLLDEYDATTLPDTPPVSGERIDTTVGDIQMLTRDIDALRAKIRTDAPKDAQQRFAQLDALYVEAARMAKTEGLKRAVLVCHKQLAENYSHAKPQESSPFALFGKVAQSAEFITSGAAFLTSGKDELSVRQQLIRQADKTPMEMNLTPGQLLELIKIKNEMDLIRMDGLMKPEERFDAMIGVIANNSGVLEMLAKESERKLEPTQALGWKVQPAMKGVFNAEAIDWLVSAHVSAEPVYGMSDQTFFDMAPTAEASVAGISSRKSPGRSTAKSEIPDFTISSTNPEKDKTSNVPEGRALSPDELVSLGIKAMPGETIKEIAPGQYIACFNDTCRKVVPSTEKDDPAAAFGITRSVIQPVETPAEQQRMPEGIAMDQAAREFRLSADEEFTVTYNPPMSGASSASFGPQLNTSFDGIVLNAHLENDGWRVQVRPNYRGTVTLTRKRDNASVSMKLEAARTDVAGSTPSRGTETVHAGEVHEIDTQEEFDRLVLRSDKPVIVDFHAVWCTPCKKLSPRIERIAKRRKDVTVVKVDADKMPSIFETYVKIDPKRKERLLPTIAFFERGSLRSSLTGDHEEGIIENQLPPSDPSIVQNR